MPAAGSYRPIDIRNIVLAGHGGAGKTTLAEAILHKCGVITRMGSVEESNTTSDFEPEAKAHTHSTSATLLYVNYEGKQINMIDAPGYPDFVGQALAVRELGLGQGHITRVFSRMAVVVLFQKRRRHVIAAPPYFHLVVTVLSRGLRLVETLE